MDELPQRARDLLALAREAHQPTPDARERVRRGVALALAAGAAASASATSTAAAASGAGTGAAKSGLLATALGKMLLAGGAVVAIGAASIALRSAPERPQQPRSAASHAPIAAPTARIAEAPAPPPSAAVAQPVAPTPTTPQLEPVATDTPKPARKARTSTATATTDDDLRAEMTVLSTASSALERGDFVAARSALADHRARFAHGQLREERIGLEAVTRCMAGEAGASERARAYLKSAPGGVLAGRVAAACELGNAP